jgi:hypothetical protein
MKEMNIKFSLGKISSGGVTLVQNRTTAGDIIEANSREDMEATIIQSTEENMHQALHTPFMQPPLMD